MALMARAYNQAQKFGAEMAIPDEAISLGADRPVGPFTLDLQIGERVKARPWCSPRARATGGSMSRTSMRSRRQASTIGRRR